MITTAREIQAALKAGLVLWGKNEFGQPEWVGTNEKWFIFKILMSK